MTSIAPASRDCAVVELRQYTLHPGRRDALVELFDRAFIEPQEAVGMRVIGQFRDVRDPNRFVWLRGFADLGSRAPALRAFYGGPVWAENSQAANATMVDSDDVLLLRPAWPGSGVTVQQPRPAVATVGDAPGLVDATVFRLRTPPTPGLLDAARIADLVLREGGALDTGWYVTDPGPNAFPRLPVREGVQVLVGIALFARAADYDAFLRSGRWAAEAGPRLQPHLAAQPQALRLTPTARSALRAR